MIRLYTGTNIKVKRWDVVEVLKKNGTRLITGDIGSVTCFDSYVDHNFINGTFDTEYHGKDYPKDGVWFIREFKFIRRGGIVPMPEKKIMVKTYRGMTNKKDKL